MDTFDVKLDGACVEVDGYCDTEEKDSGLQSLEGGGKIEDVFQFLRRNTSAPIRQHESPRSCPP